jgi:hypothetical protein
MNVSAGIFVKILLRNFRMRFSKLVNFSRRTMWLVQIAIALSTATAAFSQGVPIDVQGSKDHPYIKRFANSTIITYDQKRFDSVEFQTSTFSGFNLNSRQR